MRSKTRKDMKNKKQEVCSCYPNYPDDDNYVCNGCGLILIEE